MQKSRVKNWEATRRKGRAFLVKVPQEELMMLLSSDDSEQQMTTVVKDVGNMKSCASLSPRKRPFNVGLLVTENRRLHALVPSLEFQLSRCTCEGPIEVVEVIDEDVFDDADAVSDDVLASTLFDFPIFILCSCRIIIIFKVFIKTSSCKNFLYL